MIASRDCIPFASLDDVPLDLVDNPDRELDEENTSHTHRRFDSRRQFLNRLEDGLAELVPPLSAYPQIKGFTDVSAGQPQFDIARFFDHRVL